MINQKPFLGSILLIAGTAIGAGMLGLPVVTALGGFWPAVIVFVVTWGIMLVSALMLLEVNMALPAGCNLLTMAQETMGVWGKVIAWGSYLLLLYALDAAYLSGMSAMLQSASTWIWSMPPAQWTFVVGATLLFIGIVFWGTQVMDYLNRWFVGALIATYLVLVAKIAPHVQLAQLMPMDGKQALLALPIVVTAFGFHIVIPSLRVYLKKEEKSLRKAVIIGSSLPVLVYVCWEALILGVVPLTGTEGLIAMRASAQPTVDLALGLEMQLQSHIISIALNAFTFCAITTSLIGVSLSLCDFIVDGLKLSAGWQGRLFASASTLLPPMIFALFYPKGFLLALGYGGVFVAVLLILLPALMLLCGRRRGMIVNHVFSKFAPVLLMIFAVLVIGIEFY